MSAFLFGVASLLLFFGLVIALPYLHGGWRRVMNRNAELEIWPVMRRLGISPAAAARSDTRMARALRRCVMCPSLDECEQWLASGKTDGIDEFCPNASVLEGLRKR